LANPTKINVRKIKNKIAAKKLRDLKRKQFSQITMELEIAKGTITALNDTLRGVQNQLTETKRKLLRAETHLGPVAPQDHLTVELDCANLLLQSEPEELMLITTNGPIVWPDCFPLYD
jgi:hypothetical protein